jgi:hypothetical protein
MPGLVWYRAKPRQSGIFRYRTGIIDAGMPMPALVSSMPMPSYAVSVHISNAHAALMQKNDGRLILKVYDASQLSLLAHCTILLRLQELQKI